MEWSECWRIFEWSIIVVSLCAFQISLGGTCVHGRGVWLNVGEKEGGGGFHSVSNIQPFGQGVVRRVWGDLS